MEGYKEVRVSFFDERDFYISIRNFTIASF